MIALRDDKHMRGANGPQMVRFVGVVVRGAIVMREA